MATILKRAKGYEVQIAIKGVRVSKTLPTKKLAQDWAFHKEYEIRSQVEDGVNLSVTLKELFNRYEDEVSLHKKGERWESIRLEKFRRDPISGKKLAQLKREDFEEWIDHRIKVDKVKPSTVNRELNLISHCLTQARRWRLMKDNPLSDLKRPKNPPHRDRRISQLEIDAVLICLNYSEISDLDQAKQRTGAAFLFAIETAMRAGEICSLCPETVNLMTRVAHLPETKNGCARDVPLSSEAVRLLKRVDCNFKLSSGVLSSSFLKAVRASGVEGLTFHDTRHEGITRLAKKLDILDLARAVGHRNINQLQTYYNASAEEIALQLD